MAKEVKIGLHNRFDIIKRDAKTGEVLGEYKAENVILNQYWNYFLAIDERKMLNQIRFGSGTATPLATDTALTSQLGAKTATVVSVDKSKFYEDGTVAVKRTCRLQDSEYIGKTISEVGLGSNYGGVLHTKALIKDANGNAISITKGKAEIIDIFSTFYSNYGDYRAGVSKDGIELEYCNWISESTHFTYDAARYTMLPVSPFGYSIGIPKYDTGAVAYSFDIPNKKIIVSVPNIFANNGNLTSGLKTLIVKGAYISIPNTGLSQPVITKEVIGTGDGSTTDFTCKFGYVLDNGTAKVYVNDVEVPTIISYNKPPSVEMMALKAVAGQPIPTFENIYAGEFNITSVTLQQDGSVFVSNDLETWVRAVKGGNGNTIGIPAQYQNYRYWRSMNYAETGTAATSTWKSSQLLAFRPIKLAAPPAVGDVVTLTYQPDCIPKDDQHVLNNVKVTFSFNEYVPE